MGAVDTTVADNPGQSRFEIRVGGEVAGFTAYRPLDRELDREYAFTHTEIDPSYEGKGLGSVLVRGALDETKARGLGVLPYCPFVLRYVQRHPEYLELVPAWARERFGLPAADRAAG